MIPRPSRPFSVTLLALGVLTLAGINLLRFVVSLQQRRFLAEILPISPLYLTTTGLIWGLIGAILALGLWAGWRWSVLGTALVSLAYSLYYWFDRLFVVAEGVGRNWLFALAVNLVLLAVVYWCLMNRKAKAFFGVKYGRKSQN